MTIEQECVERVKQKALEYDPHRGCSQSVLLSLQEEFGLGDLQSFKAATDLYGDVARRSETCWVALGALMALGLAVGRERMEDTDRYREAMVPAEEIVRRFQEEIQSQFRFS